jgi:vacuolar-type H+-ATPase subunit E/Vma4
MALQDIFSALDEQADAECRETLDNAKAQAKAILEEAREEAARIRQRKLDGAEATVGTKAAQIVNAAKLQNKRDIAALKERAIGAVFDDARSGLSKVRSDAAYEALFRKLAEEALGGMDGQVEVKVDPRDEALAARILGEMGVAFTIDASAEGAGGLTAIYDGGRIFRRNTLEDRLDKVRLIGQSQVAEILFE